MKSALFVDFDNVYSGLKRLDGAFAEAFAVEPMRWLEWITGQLQIPLEPAASVKRRILVRRCYLNPVLYQRYRFGFSKAGFEIVDCPPMTTAGKTSTDIHMVLDMVDVLQSETRYDEFIVFSADADFTPVLRKLRRDDRRTTIFAAGATSAAYDASSDLIIDPDAFISQALGFGEQAAASGLAPRLEGLLVQAEAVTWEAVEKSATPLSLPSLTKALATRVPGLIDSNWAGRGTFTALLRDLALTPLQIDRESNCLVDPRRFGRDAIAAQKVKPAVDQGLVGATQQIRKQAESIVAEAVAASERPIAVASLAHLVRQRCGGIDQDWNGAGSFKKLLETLHPAKVQFSWSQLGGYAFDPQRHSLDFVDPTAQTGKDNPAQDPRWAAVGPLLQVAGFPALSGLRYRTILEALAQSLGSQPFSLGAATAQLRDVCAERKTPVGRADIYALIRALLFNGFDPNQGTRSFEGLVTTLCNVAVAACAREGLIVNDGDRAALQDWVMTPRRPESAR